MRLGGDARSVTLATVVAGVVLGAGVSACGSGARHAPTPPGTVVMRNIAFNPDVTHARVGQTIRWVNRDDAPHNVTYVSGPRFTSSVTFKNGGSFALKLTHAGAIRYECTIHPGMDGEIVVAP
jgi:plastocyanin